MTTEPESNLDPAQDPAQSPPAEEIVEETIALVKPDGETSKDASAIAAETDGEATAQEPLTPAKMDRFECRSCGYTYEPAKGDSRGDIPPGVEFRDLPNDWRCSVCGASTTQFSNIGPSGRASGFKENLNYGLGVNRLTPGQKNVLIFGALGIAILFFLSLYGLR
ncbi:MAG: rubredoxin [Phormidesmis sp.]